MTLHYAVAEDEVPGLDEGDVIRFARVVTAKGTSEYSVNEQPLPSDKYAEALREIGIDTKARNFMVFQGDVESLASKKPKEMLAHFELVSGSAELREPYEETQAALEAARREANSKQVAKRAALNEKKHLTEQKAAADAYSALRVRVDALSTQVVLTKLFYLDTQILAQEATHEAAVASVSAGAGNEARIASDIAGYAKAAAAASKLATKKAVQADSKASDALSASAMVLQLEERLKTLRGRLGAAGSEESSAAAAVKSIGDEVRSLEEECEGIQGQLNALDKASGAGGGAGSKAGKKGKGGAGTIEAEAPTLGDADRSEYVALKTKERSETADRRAIVDRLGREAANAEAESSRLAGIRDSASKRADELSASVSSRDEKVAKLSASVASGQVELKEKQSDLKATQEEHKRAEARMAAVGGELEEVKAQCSALQAQASKSDNEKRVDAAVEDMRRLFPGVLGRLYELITPAAKKYNTAVTVALGRHADAVVVATESSAHECIRFLRERKVRPMTFLPLDTLAPKEVPEAVHAAVSKNTDAGLRLARNVVVCKEEAVEKAIAFALSDTLVCDSLEFAMTLRYKKGLEAKVVALDGTIVARNGNITGGQAVEVGRGGAKWDEKALKAAEARRSELLREEETLRRRLSRGRGPADVGQSLLSIIEATEGEIANAARRLDGLAKAIKSESAAAEAERKEDAAARKEANEAAPKLAALASAADVTAAELAAQNAEVDKVASVIFASLCKKLGLASIREYESSVLAQEDAQGKKRGALHDALSKLKSKLDYERTRKADAEATLSRVRKAGGDSGSEAAKIDKELAACREKASAGRAEEAALRGEADAARASQKEAEAARDKLASARSAAQEIKASAAKAAAAADSTLEKLRLSRHDLLTQAQMDKLSLPVKAAPAPVPEAGAGGKRGRKEEPEDVEMDGLSGGIFTQGGGVDGSQGITTATTQALVKDQERSNRIDYDALDEVNRDLDKAGVDSRVKVRGCSPAMCSPAPSPLARMLTARTPPPIHSQAMDVEAASITAQMAKMTVHKAAGEKLADAIVKADAATAEDKAAREKASDLEAKFGALKSQRRSLLVSTIEATAAVLEEIYAELTRDKVSPKGGQASLTLMNELDPFDPELGGVAYYVIPPGKQYRAMESRSGGEKTMATLSLLYAMQAARPSPFFIMDEVDAALDNVNVRHIAEYVRKRSRGQGAGSNDTPLQIVVISLKDGVYERADRLAGIYRDSASDNTSRVMTLQLSDYPERAAGAAELGASHGSVQSSMGPPQTTAKPKGGAALRA